VLFRSYDTIEEQKKKVRTNLFFADVIAKIALLDDNQARTVAASIEAASGFTVNCNSKSHDINEVKSGLIDVAHSSVSYFQTAPYFNDATSNGSLMTELDVYHLIGLATKKGVTTMTTEQIGDDTINVFRFTESIAALDMDVQKDPIICKFQKENNNPFYMQVGEFLKREFKKDNNPTFIKMSMWTDNLNKTIPIGEWHPSIDRKRLNPFVKSLLEQHPTEKVVPAKV
jgi:hypothetical protein